jgi:hypothetical protein
MMRETLPTAAQPAFVCQNITYLPIYKRPVSKLWYTGPCSQLYTAKELVDAGAQMIMLDLWERPWLTELVKVKDNTTSGEIKREYQKLFGIV